MLVGASDTEVVDGVQTERVQPSGHVALGSHGERQFKVQLEKNFTQGRDIEMPSLDSVVRN